ncbi:uncharacterized protein PF3D7_1120000-like [Anolis sagrei]|uniref:uncharacterized protein PF3D7_1120000-like n=1 Tax=Anolis sagrei TaxID=38937 RepID=UPI0035218401
MAALRKGKTEKEKEKDKDKELEKRTTLNARKGSLPEEPTTKDLMKELLKIQAEIKTIQNNQEAQTKASKSETEAMKKDMKDMKEELQSLQSLVKEEMTTVKNDVGKLKQDNIDLIKDNTTIKNHQEMVRKKVKSFEELIDKVQSQQEMMEIREKETQLRFRNVIEEEEDNIREVIVDMIAQLTKKKRTDAETEVDRVFRIQTTHSRKFKTPKDIIVQLTKKNTRDEILREHSKSPLQYKGNRIVILKQIPISVLERRRNYNFLTDELKRRNLRFKWEKREGLVTTWNENKYWLTSEAKARAFWDKYLKKKNENKQGYEEEGRGKCTPHHNDYADSVTKRLNLLEEEDNEKGRKRPREISPGNYTFQKETTKIDIDHLDKKSDNDDKKN